MFTYKLRVSKNAAAHCIDILMIPPYLPLELLRRGHVPVLLGIERPDGGPGPVPVQLELEEDLRVGVGAGRGRGGGPLGAAPHLLVLERVPPLPAVLHPQQGQGQLAQELESAGCAD